MLAKTIHGTSDSNIFFSEDKKSGLLIQPKLRRVLFFVNNDTKDTLYYEQETTVSDVDKWIKEKRKLYEQEKASRMEPKEA